MRRSPLIMKLLYLPEHVARQRFEGFAQQVKYSFAKAINLKKKVTELLINGVLSVDLAIFSCGE